MSGKYLLDTNIVIALFAEDPSIQKRIARAGEIFIPAVVIGELFFGAFKSARPKANSTRIENFAAVNTILACDVGTGREYGHIKKFLHEKGQPIPENDIWIAALAREHGLTLVSRDEHFNVSLCNPDPSPEGSFFPPFYRQKQHFKTWKAVLSVKF